MRMRPAARICANSSSRWAGVMRSGAFQFWAEFLLMETVRMNVDKHENRPKKPKNKRFQRLLEALEQL